MFLDQAEQLLDGLSSWDLSTTKKKLALSDNLAQKVHKWHQSWSRTGGHAAGWTFQGDAFKTLDLDSFTVPQALHAQKHLRILNGAYGILRPLDKYCPVRLEMGQSWCPVSSFDNIAQFWRPKLAEVIHREAQDLHENCILNLASAEYANVALHGLSTPDIVTCVFFEKNNGALKSVSAFAKAARGAMARFVLTRGITTIEELRKFAELGYQYSEIESSPNKKVFIRTSRP